MNNLNNLDFTEIKNVILRVDFNVPIDQNFIIQDFTRISRSRETIEKLHTNKCKILILTHFGRPNSKFEENYSLKNIYIQISKELNKDIQFISYDEFQRNSLSKFHDAKDGIFLLDNIRFLAGEKENDPAMSDVFTQNMNLYVNEAFSAAHRSHASVDQMAKNIQSCPGINFLKEIEAIDSIKKIDGKTLAIIGGSKVSTKIEALLSLVKSCSNIFIGGAMANNFLKFQDFHVSNSLVEENIDIKVKAILHEAEKNQCKIHLPQDVVINSGHEILVQDLNNNHDFKIFDIGSQSINTIKNITKDSDVILWNGPLGLIENTKFSKGSVDIAKYLSKSHSKVIVGGGDTLLALKIAQLDSSNYYFVSTAGGAFLEALEDKVLPAVKALAIQ
ncbi:MAG: phosphoglycerate kinase [Alphaproteobacteria bacterium]|nr:phosphoglycerate kinase [Alphaproteobacteria bacterium]